MNHMYGLCSRIYSNSNESQKRPIPSSSGGPTIRGPNRGVIRPETCTPNKVEITMPVGTHNQNGFRIS